MENWRPVPGWEGFYDVSDIGRVRSLDRVVIRSNGRQYTAQGRVLRPGTNRGYPMVVLHRPDRSRVALVHHLVLEAFVGPRPPGMETRHFPDRDRMNARLENLSWGTRLENGADRIAHGTTNLGKRWKLRTKRHR